MHSKIIYLIENENELTNSFGGHLPLEYLITNETLFDHINECDYVEAYYSNDNTEEIDSIYIETFENSNYFEFNQNEQGVCEVSIGHDNVINWDKRLLELNEKYNTIIKDNLSKNQFTNNHPFDTFQECYEHDEMLGDDIGGVKFVIYRDIDGELDFYSVFNISDLICYAKSTFGIQSKGKVEFQICTNVMGDYHY